jgi:uncharacterized protein YodC (DUF2158 family)
VGDEIQINTGDVVRLKGGDTVMLVRTISGDHAYCTWFRDITVHSGTFRLSNLESLTSARRVPAESPDHAGPSGDTQAP